MGVRSDVAIAMRKCVYNHLSPEAREVLDEYGFVEEDTVDAGEDAGTLFVTRDIKWYHTSNDDLVEFYKHLEDCHDEADYLIVEACHDYPESDEANEGLWHDNPWGVFKSVSVSISWA